MNVHRLYNNKYSYRNREPRLRFFKYSPSQYHRGSDKKKFWRQSVFISRRESRVSPSNPSLSLVHSTGPGRFPSNFNRGPAKKTRPGDTRAAGALFESRCFSLVVSARTTRGALLSLSLSVTPSARCGVVSGQRRAAWRPCQALLFSPGLCKIRPLCSSTTDLSTRFIHQPNPILFLPLSYRSSSPLSPPLSLSVSLSLVSPAPSKFVPSYSQPYQRPRVCVSTSTFTGACLRSNTRFLRPRVEHPPLCPRAHSTLHSLARSLARSGPLAAPFLLDLPFRGRSSSRYAAQYCKQPAKRTFARMQTVHRPPVTAFYISPWWRADASCIRPRTTRNPPDPRPDETRRAQKLFAVTEIFRWDNCIYRGGKHLVLGIIGRRYEKLKGTRENKWNILLIIYEFIIDCFYLVVRSCSFSDKCRKWFKRWNIIIRWWSIWIVSECKASSSFEANILTFCKYCRSLRRASRINDLVKL